MIFALLDADETETPLRPWLFGGLAAAGLAWLIARAVWHEKKQWRKRGEIAPIWGPLLGRCAFRPDRSFVMTEWFPLLFPVLAVFPMRSFRIRALEEGPIWWNLPRKFVILECLPICWSQVARAYGCRVAWILWVYTLWKMVIWFRDNIDGSHLYFVAIGYFLLIISPFFLRGYFWECAMHRAQSGVSKKR